MGDFDEIYTASEMIADIQKIRDRVTGKAMQSFGGRNRELALVMTKLDEARMWAVEHGVATRSHEVVDIAKLQENAAAIHNEQQLRNPNG